MLGGRGGVLADAGVDCRPVNSAEAVAALCYPRPSRLCVEARLPVLAESGVRGLALMGSTTLVTPAGPVRVLGKGHSSVVIAACTRRGMAVIKSRRTDSKRSSLEMEAMALIAASGAGASPRVHAWGRDVIVMDLVPGPVLEEAARDCQLLARVAGESLDAARALDTAMILHKELSRPHRHVIFTGDPRYSKALIIDLESAALGKCGSLTRIASFWARRLRVRDPGLWEKLRTYKREGCPRRLYESVKELIVGAATGSCPP